MFYEGMALVPAGSCKMGGGTVELCPDGLPVHKVTFSQGFRISREPVSYDLFASFSREVCGCEPDAENHRGYVTGVSWLEAQAFCQWLGEKENKAYRLPTEAEWEYCARNAKAFGIDRLCDLSLREWCFDWHGEYTDKEATDPAGPSEGFFKVVRGGFLDNPLRYNEYPLDLWRRGSLPPNYRHFSQDIHNSFGRHPVGFRVVIGKEPVTGGKSERPALSRCVKQKALYHEVQVNEAAEKPFYKKRLLFPSPPDNGTSQEITAIGLNPALRHHNHSPGFCAAPNGDLLVSIYSTYHEYDAEGGLMGARLKYGAEEWEIPDIFLNPAGVNDHAPLLFTDWDGAIYHFWGWQQLDDSFPFQYMVSRDNGETWTGPVFPRFVNKAERVIRQPVNSVIHAKDGWYYLVCDSSEGSCSVLWRSRDLLVWENPGGRTAGRHTTAVELKDGGLFALGGKNSDIDGYMPKAVSYDRGDTWTVEKTPFPALTSGQRPCVIRLKSGRLFMCGDYQNKHGKRPYPQDDPRWGSYGAYSEDEGKTWTFKRLLGTQPRKRDTDILCGADTLGYSVCCQSPDGLIHIVTSNTHPCLHLSFNEAWLLTEDRDGGISDVMKGYDGPIRLAKTYKEYYCNGKIRCEYAMGLSEEGRMLLHGQEKWYYPSGALEFRGEYDRGRKVGTHTCFSEDGLRQWEWQQESRGNRAVYKTYYDDGQLKSSGSYVGRFADGPAQTYSRSGEILTEVFYRDGKIYRVTDFKRETPAPMAEIFG